MPLRDEGPALENSFRKTAEIMEFIDTTGVAKPEDRTGNKVTSVHLVASVFCRVYANDSRIRTLIDPD
jgi:hypothetical protein